MAKKEKILAVKENGQDSSDKNPSQESAAPARTGEEKVELDLEGLKSEKEKRLQTLLEEPESTPELAETSPEGPGPTPKVSSKPIRRKSAIALAAALLVLLLGTSWFGYRYVRNQNRETQEPIVVKSDPPQEDSRPLPATEPLEPYQLHRLASFFIPMLTDQNGEDKFLRISVIFAFRDDTLSEEIDRKILLVRGQITDLLLGKSLSVLKSEEGRAALRQEIKDLVNSSLTRGTVAHVYFKDISVY